MDLYHGYAMVSIGKGKCWHLSTMNDESIHGGVINEYITFEQTADMSGGICLRCVRFLEKHGNYQGYDSKLGRMFSISNPKPAEILTFECYGENGEAIHRGACSQATGISGACCSIDDDGTDANDSTEYVPETFAITTMRINGDENIHRTGCADIRRSQIKHGIWADEPWDLTVTSLRDYAEQYWGDICTDYGPWGSEEWLAELKDHSTYGKWHACVPNIPEGEWL